MELTRALLLRLQSVCVMVCVCVCARDEIRTEKECVCLRVCAYGLLKGCF